MPHVVPGAASPLRGLLLARACCSSTAPSRRTGDGEEDVDFNARLIRAGVALGWAPDVMTAHRYAGTAAELLRDQRRRGDLRYRSRGHRRARGLLAGRALLDAPAGLWRAASPRSPVARTDLARSAPLVLAGSVAAAGGILTAERA